MSRGKPENPRLLLFDTSALLPFLATNEISALRFLRADYGIASAITEAVESEALMILTHVAKFKGRDQQLIKAISKGTLSVTGTEFLESLFGERGKSMSRQMDGEGRRLNLRVDRGEAYTHAAATALPGSLVVTNDVSAVHRLIAGGEMVPRPVLRFWDLIVLLHQGNYFDGNKCDGFRRYLEGVGERLPECFRKKAFQDGLAFFYPRIVDGGLAEIGARSPLEALDERLVIYRTTRVTAPSE